MPMNTFFYCIMATTIFLCTTKEVSIELDTERFPLPPSVLPSLPSSAQSFSVLQVHFFQTQSEILSEEGMSRYFP